MRVKFLEQWYIHQWKVEELRLEPRSSAVKYKTHFFFFFFPFLSCPCGIWKFPGQGSNPSQSCNLCHSCSNAWSLTHCVGPGIKEVPPQRQARYWTNCKAVGTPQGSFLYTRISFKGKLNLVILPPSSISHSPKAKISWRCYRVPFRKIKCIA